MTTTIPSAEYATQLAAAGKAEDFLDVCRYKALTNLYFFSKAVLNYKDLSARLHQEFCEYIINSRQQRRRGALIPRGHFKSTIVSKSYPLWRLIPISDHMLNRFPDLEEWLPYHNPNHRIVIVGESETVGAKNLKDIKHNIERNELLQSLFPEIIPPDIGKTVWREDSILLPRSMSFDENSITTLGVGAKTTGMHWDIIVYDDLIGEKAAKSEAVMEDAKHWFKFAPGLANDPETVEELFIGTRWKAGVADLYGYVMATLPSDEEDVNSTPAINSEGERAGGFTWYIRSAVEPDPVTGNPTPIFPERFTLATLAAIEKREGAYAYSCNYLNNPIAEGVTDFDVRWLQEYEVKEDGFTLQPKNGTPSIRLAQLTRISFLDPSSGGKSAKCEASIAAIGADSLFRKFLLNEWSENTTYGGIVCKWMQLNDRFHFYKNYYEKVGASASIEDTVKLVNLILRSGKPCPQCKGKHSTLRIEPITPPGGKAEKSKDDRIRGYLQEPTEALRMYVRIGSHRKFRTQMSEFPHGELKDVLDAVAYGVHLCPTPRPSEDIQSERQRAEQKKITGKPRTYTTVDRGGY